MVWPLDRANFPAQVSNFFRTSTAKKNLCILQADKEGLLVTLPNEDFPRKASQAVGKRFVKVTVKSSKIKKEAQDSLEAVDLLGLACSIQKAQLQELSIFFTIKSHKPEQPLRATVSKRETWQKFLGGLPTEKPTSPGNS